MEFIVNPEQEQIFSQLRKAFAGVQGDDPSGANLSQTPFSRLSSNPGVLNGTPFNVMRLGDARGQLPEVDGMYWEIVSMDPGLLPPHVHDRASAWLEFIKGSGFAILGGDIYAYTSSARFYVERGTSHGFYAREPSVMISAQDHPIQAPGEETPDFREDMTFDPRKYNFS